MAGKGNPKGTPKSPGSGRAKGTPNKITTDLKSMILGALEGAGGEKYLKDQAQKNPSAFMALIGKVLPLQISSGGDKILVEIVKQKS